VRKPAKPLTEVIHFDSRFWPDDAPDTLFRRNGALYIGRSDGGKAVRITPLKAADWFVNCDAHSDAWNGSAAEFIGILRKHLKD